MRLATKRHKTDENTQKGDACSPDDSRCSSLLRPSEWPVMTMSQASVDAIVDATSAATSPASA